MIRTAWGLLLVLILTGSTSAAERLKVVTSIPPVHCFTLNVAGDLASVSSLLSSGGSAHDFQFNPRERSQLEAAGLVIINGLGMESWLADALKQSGSKLVVEGAAGLKEELIGGNPHIWLDPLLAAHMVTNIMMALQKADPANAPGYASNAVAYVSKLQALHREISERLASHAGRPIVTAHDAFPYFARRYQLRVVGVLELNPDIDPTLAHLTALRRRIESESVHALFVDAHHSSRRAKQLARDLKLRVGVLDTLESSRLKASSYEDGMRANVKALLEALP